MAFSLAGFGAGFAEKASERIDEDRVRQEKLQDEARQIATRQRLSKQAKRDTEEALTKELAESLAVYYTSDQATDILSNGKGAAKHAIAMGKSYSKDGFDPSEYFNMPDNSIANQGSNVVEIGEVSESADAPEGMGGSFAGRFKVAKPTAKDKTLAAYELSILNARLNAGNDEEALAEVARKETIFLDLQKKKADAARKNEPDVEQTFYEVPEREKKIKDYRVLARNSMSIQTGTLGELTGKMKGTNALAMAELLTAETLYINNKLGNEEKQMGREIQSITKNAANSLGSYVASNYTKITTANTFANEAERNAAAAINGTLKLGDMYAYMQPATADAPATYIAGTYIGTTYQTSLGLEGMQNALNLGPDWRPKEIN